MNRARTIPHGFDQLGAAGTLDNLRLAAGAQGTYQALQDSSGAAFPFLDSDVYKWLEAAGWELGRAHDPQLAADADTAIALVEAAQRPDGYLNSYVQVVAGGEPFQDLAWGHELYCLGHLIQAAVAWQRALGDGRLLAVARREADAVDRALGAGARDGVDGHPEVEMALVELWRVTGEGRYLALATRQIDLRGHGLLGDGRFGRGYWQDHRPVREAPTVTGHAVRQLYLDAGAVDVAVETGDRALLDAVIRRWTDMVATRTYLTGGLGSRHRDEAFGDPYELPPDRAYAETCAAIASIMLVVAPAAGDRRAALRRPDRADDLQRDAVGPLARWDVVLLRQPAPAAEPSLRGDPRRWRSCAVVSVRLLPAQPHAPAGVVGAVPRHVRRRRDPGPPVRDRDDRGRAGRRAGPARDDDRLPVVRAGRDPRARDAGCAVDPVAAHPAGRERGEADAARGAVEGSRPARSPPSVAAGGRAMSSCSTSSWRRPSRRPTRGSTRPAAASPCSGAHSSTASRRPTCRTARSSRTSRSRRPSRPAVEDRADIAPGIIGLTMPARVQRSGAGSESIELRAIPYFAWANRSVEAMRVWIPARPSDQPGDASDANGRD